MLKRRRESVVKRRRESERLKEREVGFNRRRERLKERERGREGQGRQSRNDGTKIAFSKKNI